MATLHVRGVPDALYEQVRRLAQVRQASIRTVIIELLEQALGGEPRGQEQAALLAAIWRDRFTPSAGMDSVTLLHEDRAR
jgi:hypothetical protein